MSGPWTRTMMDASSDWHVVIAITAVVLLHWIVVGIVVVAMFPVTRVGRSRVGAPRRRRAVPVLPPRQRCRSVVDAERRDGQRKGTR